MITPSKSKMTAPIRTSPKIRIGGPPDDVRTSESIHSRPRVQDENGRTAVVNEDRLRDGALPALTTRQRPHDQPPVGSGRPLRALTLLELADAASACSS